MIAIESTSVSLDTVRESVRTIQRDHRATIDAFHQVFYQAPTWSMTVWLGVPLMKSPCDLFALQDILWGLRPALIIETGTAYGGSALFMATICDQVGSGVIVSIDLEPHATLPAHPRITYRRGSSTDAEIVAYVRDRASRCVGPVLVVLDSDHRQAHVAAELAAYADLVTVGSFLIVEDTNVNGRPVLEQFGPGPGEAVDAFLVEHPEFTPDALPERYLITMHPGGWLRRVA